MRILNIFVVIALLSSSRALCQVNLSSSLTACYALDGNAGEPINNLTGTLSSVSATLGHLGTANTGMQFSGQVSSFIMLPNSPLLKPNQISFSAWVKTDNLTINQAIVFTKNPFVSFHTSYGLAIVNTGSGYKFQLSRQNGSGADLLYSTTSVLANTWYQVAFCLDNTTMQLYVNGVLENSIIPVITSFNYDPTRYVILGGTNETVNIPFSGTLDNIRFYNRLLSSQELNAIYLQDPACSVVPGLPPQASFSVSTLQVCAGGTMALTDLSINTPTSWVWQMPGALTPSSSASNPTIGFSSPGNYVISLVSTNAFGASNTATQSVFVTPNPTINILSTHTLLCTGRSATLVATGASGYIWSTGQSGPYVMITPTQATSYTVTGSDNLGCSGTAVFTQPVTLSSTVNAVSSKSLICKNIENSVLTALGAVTYTWNTTELGSSIVVSPVVQTTYVVTGTDNNGCTNTASITVNVQNCNLSDIGEHESGNFDPVIYPNPAKNSFEIGGMKGKPFMVLVTDILGKEVLSAQQGTTCFIEGLPGGIYFVRIRSENLFKVIKLLKE